MKLSRTPNNEPGDNEENELDWSNYRGGELLKTDVNKPPKYRGGEVLKKDCNLLRWYFITLLPPTFLIIT